ncbi:guanine nucleotide-binding protein G(q) subunit alpha-like isoform X3 [Portunus trituberculatus]|uniref:guanine nucleotide-binding protein G(q) subunit alpha-like isoform X3 n=1 Tax=Portunus trituberculatus TaxID=210409 RepID=UPI001E1CE638|nr:guanine nucleotide-binding protein G(q) subunit alpha-like isoform X3 [Portunus trituberculatus]
MPENYNGPPRPSFLQRAWGVVCSLVEYLRWCLAWQPPEASLDDTTFDKCNTVEARLLVLGAADTGKSTFMKQMRYVFGDTFPVSERRRHLPYIRQNLLESVHKLVVAMDVLGVPYSTAAAQDAAERFVDMTALEAFFGDDSPMDLTLVEETQTLWEDEGVQEVFRRGNEYHLMTNADHFITSAARILHYDYLPTIDDILRMRYPTQCSVTTTYDVGEMRMTVHDMGGERSARGEWVGHFSRPTAILFLASLAEYDQQVEEAEREGEIKNRVQESLDIFDVVLKYPPFHNSPVILLLNKSDIFKKKIIYHSLAHYFPQYDGPDGDEDKGREFLSGLYEELAARHGRHYVSRFTEATNTENFNSIFSFVKNIVSRNIISRGGLL